jgi:GAF domain-containing protein
MTTSAAASAARPRDSVTARMILQGTVDIARTVFAAYSASVLLLDEGTGQLVFEAVAHPDEQHLVGMSFAATSGIAGWVLQSGQTMMIDDVAEYPNFARQTAESTGYIPRHLMAAPVGRDDEWIGVLEVLDRTDGYRGQITDVALLSQLADQAAASLGLIQEARRAGLGPSVPAADSQAMAAVDGILRHICDVAASGPEDDGSLQLLVSLSRVLNARSHEMRNG